MQETPDIIGRADDPNDDWAAFVRSASFELSPIEIVDSLALRGQLTQEAFNLLICKYIAESGRAYAERIRGYGKTGGQFAEAMLERIMYAVRVTSRYRSLTLNPPKLNGGT